MYEVHMSKYEWWTGVEDHRNHSNSHTTVHPRYRHGTPSLGSLTGRRGWCYNFLSVHLHMSSSHRTLASRFHHVFTFIILQHFITMFFVYTCSPLVFRRMYFIHATYMLDSYLLITCHASMAHLYINLSVDLACSLHQENTKLLNHT